jgi:hypothetical protein
MFASSRHLHLEHVCTHGTPVKKNLGYLEAFPIIVSFLGIYFQDDDADNLIAALEHRDRVKVVQINVPPSLFEELATAMREPLPALTHLRLEISPFVALPIIPDTFLGGSAPRLKTIYIADIPYPAAPTLLLSARDLVDVDLRSIPSSGFIPPEAMVASLAALPKLQSLTFGFEWGMSYHDRIRLHSITRTVLPALTRFLFDGLFEYIEDFVAQIDAPQLNYLHIEYLYEGLGTDYQIPELCKFIDRSDKLKLSHFRRADLTVGPLTVVELCEGGRSSFRLSIQEDAISQVVNQLSPLLTYVDCLFIDSETEELESEWLGDDIRWLELFRPFTATKALSVNDKLSSYIPLALKNVTSERAAEVLPALRLLRLKNKLIKSMKKFAAARRNVGRPVAIVSDDLEFSERLHVDFETIPSVTIDSSPSIS